MSDGGRDSPADGGDETPTQQTDTSPSGSSTPADESSQPASGSGQSTTDTGAEPATEETETENSQRDSITLDTGRVETFVSVASDIADTVHNRTEAVTLPMRDDEDEFFTTDDGLPTTTTRYDLEKVVDNVEKPHLTEVDRYWVNKPYSFVVIYRSDEDQELKYHSVEPYMSAGETIVREFFRDRLHGKIVYSDEAATANTPVERVRVLQQQVYALFAEYGFESALPQLDRSFILDSDATPTPTQRISIGSRERGLTSTGEESDAREWSERVKQTLSRLEEVIRGGGDTFETEPTANDEFLRIYQTNVRGVVGIQATRGATHMTATNKRTDDGLASQIQPYVDSFKAVLSDSASETDTEAGDGQEEADASQPRDPAAVEDSSDRAQYVDELTDLTPHQGEKILYYLKRDFVGFNRIDPIKHDTNVEDISCNGYDSPVFVYHTEYEQVITNVKFDSDTLNQFATKMAQRAGKSINQRNPTADLSLRDGSRANITLGQEISRGGTNFTIRQFKDVPFTPIDLINWQTMRLDIVAFLWLAVENNQNTIVAGGTASGKTTTLNALSLLIPSKSKLVSIEDTPELQLPQKNWIGSVTRESGGDSGTVDEFHLLENALRQRPDYIPMGEVRGEEGRTLFQAMSTGHTGLTTFHADSVDEVYQRFTSEPINVSKTLFPTLDIVLIQQQTDLDGTTVRRIDQIAEVQGYDREQDRLESDVLYDWDAIDDAYDDQTADSAVLDDIESMRGWTRDKTQEELQRRKYILAYMVVNDVNRYRDVAAVLQAYYNSPELVLEACRSGEIEKYIDGFTQIESITIDISKEAEESVPRPDTPDHVQRKAEAVLKDTPHINYSGIGLEGMPEEVANAAVEDESSNISTATDGGMSDHDGDE